MQFHEQENVSDLLRTIARGFTDLKRIAAHYPFICHDLDIHSLEMSISADVKNQASKAGAIQQGPVYYPFHTTSLVDKLLAATKVHEANDTSKDAMKAQQLSQFKKDYFKWAKEFLGDLGKIKLHRGWKWLDLTAVAKELGALEL